MGVIGGTSFILIAIYFCIKSEKCFCDVKGDGRDDTPDIEYAQVATDDSATEYSAGTSPMLSAKSKPHALSTPSIPSQKVVSSDDDDTQPGVSQIGEIVDDSQVGKLKKQESLKSDKDAKGRSKSLEAIRKRQVQGNLHLTIKYSKKDLFLFVVIHNITDLIPEELSGFDQVRISMVLLPNKKNRSKTKFAPVDNPEFSSSFKFSNVSRADLFQSAMRFRLYGRPVRLGMHLGGDRLLGELTVHLADAAQKEKVFTTRPFQAPSK